MPHGMPIAALLGHGAPTLTGVADPAPKLRPSDVALIGPRSWESGEAALLERLTAAAAERVLGAMVDRRERDVDGRAPGTERRTGRTPPGATGRP
jgi:hypothetical protein